MTVSQIVEDQLGGDYRSMNTGEISEGSDGISRLPHDPDADSIREDDALAKYDRGDRHRSADHEDVRRARRQAPR